ncbi:hypothetical protein ACF0H5_023247 [Mactra antiquata]
MKRKLDETDVEYFNPQVKISPSGQRGYYDYQTQPTGSPRHIGRPMLSSTPQAQYYKHGSNMRRENFVSARPNTSARQLHLSQSADTELRHVIDNFVAVYEQLDKSDEIDVKPNYSYTELAYLAMLRSQNFCLPIAEIYSYIQGRFKFFRNSTRKHWKNAVRHSLAKTMCFSKIAVGRGTSNNESLSRSTYLWCIIPNSISSFARGDYRATVDKETGTNTLRSAYFSTNAGQFWDRVGDYIASRMIVFRTSVEKTQNPGSILESQTCAVPQNSGSILESQTCAVPQNPGSILESQTCAVPQNSGSILESQTCAVPQNSGSILESQTCAVPQNSGSILESQTCAVPQNSGSILESQTCAVPQKPDSKTTRTTPFRQAFTNVRNKPVSQDFVSTRINTSCSLGNQHFNDYHISPQTLNQNYKQHVTNAHAQSVSPHSYTGSNQSHSDAPGNYASDIVTDSWLPTYPVQSPDTRYGNNNVTRNSPQLIKTEWKQMCSTPYSQYVQSDSGFETAESLSSDSSSQFLNSCKLENDQRDTASPELGDLQFNGENILDSVGEIGQFDLPPLSMNDLSDFSEIFDDNTDLPNGKLTAQIQTPEPPLYTSAFHYSSPAQVLPAPRMLPLNCAMTYQEQTFGYVYNVGNTTSTLPESNVVGYTTDGRPVFSLAGVQQQQQQQHWGSS